MRLLFLFAWVFAALVVSAASQVQSDSQSGGNDRLEMLLRTAQYADARRLIDEMLAVEPRDDLKNARAVFASGPNTRVRGGSARFSCDVSDAGVRLPLTRRPSSSRGRSATIASTVFSAWTS